MTLRCVQIFYSAFYTNTIIFYFLNGLHVCDCICISELDESAAEPDTDMTYDSFYVPSEDTSDTSSNESDIE